MVAPGLNVNIKMPKSPASIASKLQSMGGTGSVVHYEAPVGKHYGISAQRTNRSIFNARYMATTAYVHDVYDGRGINAGRNRAEKSKQTNPYEELMKYQMMTQMMQMGNQLATGIGDIVGAIKGNKSEGAGGAGEAEKSSLSELRTKSIETDGKLIKFGSDYQKSVSSCIKEKLTTEKDDPDLQQFLEGIDFSNIEPSELTITDKSTLSDLDKAGDMISNDLNKISSFETALTTASGNIQKEINRLQSEDSKNGTDNSAKISKLIALKTKLDGTVKTEVDKMKSEITNQKTTLTNLISEKKSNMDKIYSQAQKDDKQIGDNNKKMEKLAEKIKNEKKDDKKQQLIKEYNNLANANATLVSGLNAFKDNNKFDIQNSSGTTFTPTNVNNAKTQAWSDNEQQKTAQTVNITTTAPATNNTAQPSSVTPTTTSHSNSNDEVVTAKNENDIDDMKPGQKIEIRGLTYVKQDNGAFDLVGADGKPRNMPLTADQVKTILFNWDKIKNPTNLS